VIKRYYGIRFHGGNRTCTTGTPNKRTGRMSIACDVQVFQTVKERNDWVNKENLCMPCGCGGGERIACSKAYARSKQLGLSVEEFHTDLESAYSERYNQWE
jgi:hypothetical protein